MIGADQNNPTDGVIVKGIKNLLTKAYDHYRYRYLFLDDHNPMNYISNETYDLIVICGTPWLWDSFQKSTKYANLLSIFETHKDSKKLFMGIGSCLNLKDIESDILRRSAEIEGMLKLFKGTTIITRDHLANELLENADIDNTFLACPAFFAYNDYSLSKKENNVLIWCDPQKTISSGDWKSGKKLKAYHDEYMEFYNQYKPVVYCAFENEIEKAVEIGLPVPKILTGWEMTLELMKDADNVLSGRVHCAVPALARGANVKLMALDTRFYVIEDFKDSLDLESTEKEYIRILNEISVK